MWLILQTRVGDTEQLSTSRSVWATAEELIASIHPSISSSQSSWPGPARICSTVPFSLLTCYTLYSNVVYFPAGLCESLLPIGLSQWKVPGGGPREEKKWLPPLCSGSFVSSSCIPFMNPILDRVSFCGSSFYLLASGHHFLPPYWLLAANLRVVHDHLLFILSPYTLYLSNIHKILFLYNGSDFYFFSWPGW